MTSFAACVEPSNVIRVPSCAVSYDHRNCHAPRPLFFGTYSYEAPLRAHVIQSVETKFHVVVQKC